MTGVGESLLYRSGFIYGGFVWLRDIFLKKERVKLLGGRGHKGRKNRPDPDMGKRAGSVELSLGNLTVVGIIVAMYYALIFSAMTPRNIRNLFTL